MPKSLNILAIGPSFPAPLMNCNQVHATGPTQARQALKAPPNGQKFDVVVVNPGRFQMPPVIAMIKDQAPTAEIVVFAEEPEIPVGAYFARGPDQLRSTLGFMAAR